MDAPHDPPASGTGRSPRSAVAERSLLRLGRRHSTIATEVSRRIREASPAYAALDDAMQAELEKAVGESLRILLRWMSSDDGWSEDDIDFFQAGAVGAVERLIPLEAMLQAARAVQHVVWEHIVAACGDDAGGRQAALGLVADLVAFNDHVTAIITRAYIEAQQHFAPENDRRRGELLEDLLSGQLPLRRRARTRSQELGLDPDAEFVVLVARIPELSDPETLPIVVGVIERHFARVPTLVAVRRDEIIGVVASHDSHDLVKQAHEPVLTVRRLRGIDIRMGLSTPVGGLDAVSRGFDEARRALSLAAATGSAVTWLSDVPILDYLLHDPDETTRRMTYPRLSRLLEEDERSGGVLLETLRAYLSADLHAGRAAEKLVVHPNTVHYRLRRIADVTGRNLRSFDDLVELSMGIRILAPEVHSSDQGPPSARGGPAPAVSERR